MISSNPKPKWPLVLARRIATDIEVLLRPVCSRLVVAGSVRRGKQMVGDVEILYVPRLGQEVYAMPAIKPSGLAQGEMFDPGLRSPETTHNGAEAAIAFMLADCTLEKRLNEIGRPTWGSKIKLARHVMSSVPVDLFATSESSWFNYLVCRTGPAESNIAIAAAAKRKGWKWHPYSAGFRDERGREVAVRCEEEVFKFVGLPYDPPERRGMRLRKSRPRGSV